MTDEKKVVKLHVVASKPTPEEPKSNTPKRLLKDFMKKDLERVMIMGVTKDGSHLIGTTESNVAIVNLDLDIFKTFILDHVLDTLE